MAGSKMYFIAYVLPAELDQKILSYKKYMQEAYGCKVGLKSPAHITLVPPSWMDADKEPELLDLLQSFNATAPEFEMSTAGFSCFRPRTIFIAVQENELLEKQKKEMDQLIHCHPEFGLHTDSRPFHPHITIATRDLHKKDFAEAWPYFSEKNFRETWMAQKVSLLRHNQTNWEVIN